jgi:hypothetical protein
LILLLCVEISEARYCPELLERIVDSGGSEEGIREVGDLAGDKQLAPHHLER